MEELIIQIQATANNTRDRNAIREAAFRGWNDAIEARQLKASKKPQDVERRLMQALGEVVESVGQGMRRA
jgi:hypothetical protein